jgi:hypothetical protein
MIERFPPDDAAAKFRRACEVAHRNGLVAFDALRLSELEQRAALYFSDEIMRLTTRLLADARAEELNLSRKVIAGAYAYAMAIEAAAEES